MKPLHWLLALLGCLLATSARADDWITYEPKDGPRPAKHLVFLSGDEEYRSEEGLPMLAKVLSRRHGFKCTVLFAVDANGIIDPNNQKRSEEHTSELQSRQYLVCRLLLEKKKKQKTTMLHTPKKT